MRSGAFVSAIVMLILTLLPAYYIPTIQAQPAIPNIISFRVEGAANYTAPGSESFWNQVQWTNVPLAASVAPGGGHTPNLLAKSANDGFNVYILFQWNDSVGPAYGTGTELYRAQNGSLLPLTPELTANVTELYYNSTYYYPDRAAMLWFIAPTQEKQQSPAMLLGSGGAITGGAADIWHWQTVPTDNNPSDPDFPGGYTDPSGTPIYPPNNSSFAEDDYTNTTGFYVIPGNLGADSPNLSPFSDPFIVHVGSYFSVAKKTWTVEMVRSFTTDASQYRVQLATGTAHYVAFAVWNGKLGESAQIKSVSQWYTLTISNQAPSSAPIAALTPSGITAMHAGVLAISMLIVGLVIGLLAKPRRTRRSTAQS